LLLGLHVCDARRKFSSASSAVITIFACVVSPNQQKENIKIANKITVFIYLFVC
jgi:hypothetical protein